MKSRLRCVSYALVLVMGVFAAHTSTALTQAQGAGEQPSLSIDEQVRNLTEKLTLNADQQAKIRAILQEQQQQTQEAVGGNTLSREDKRSNVRRIGVTTSSRIRELLNDDQKVKFDQMEKERQDHMHASQEASGQGSPK